MQTRALPQVIRGDGSFSIERITMLELLAYVGLLLVAMPAILLATGKLIAVYNIKLSSPSGTAARAATPTSPDYETLHQRLVAAAEANPFLPEVFSRSKRKGGRKP